MNAQEIVAANVAARGYRDGWTAEQFVARQLCKMTEELGEAVEQVHPGEAPSALYRWFDHAGDADKAARRAFDTPDLWRKAYIIDPNAVRSELADMLVVLFAAAQALDFRRGAGGNRQEQRRRCARCAVAVGPFAESGRLDNLCQHG